MGVYKRTLYSKKGARKYWYMRWAIGSKEYKKSLGLVSSMTKEEAEAIWEERRKTIENQRWEFRDLKWQKLLERLKPVPKIPEPPKDYTEQRKDVRKRLARELFRSRKRLRLQKQKLKQLQEEIKELQKRCYEMQYITGLAFEPYPDVPLPMIEVNGRCKGLPSTSGIYFVWFSKRVVYVGQTTNLANRVQMTNHFAIEAGNHISFIECDKEMLNWMECYYIGLLKPIRNFANRHGKR